MRQWLHAHRAETEAELVKALRQCDGGKLQAIVMVRDDFSVAAARLMNVLDIPILQGHSFALVDLFDVDHAAKVLTKFGQAFGKLPANAGNLSADEQKFVMDVSAGLAQDDKVVSVRLSLFAEMIKGKPWTTATLAQVGGTQGIGVNFLEETFSSPQANPNHRRHAIAARSVLRSLLPELGTDIKGHMRSQQELMEASGYTDRPADFADLLRILDGELRLITPTDPEGDTLSGERLGVSPPCTSPSSSSPSPPSSTNSPRFFQLTHDYLVPSLREWLTRKQRETRKARAELTLEERSALWNAKSENRHLPSLTEWLSIRALTESKHWTAPQRAMMSRAGKIHGLRSLIVLAVTCVLTAIGVGFSRQMEERRNQAEATRLVEGLLAADTAQVSGTLTSLSDFRTWADPQLKQAFADSAADSNAKLHAGLALVAEGQTVDPAVLEFLQERMLTVTPAQCKPVRELLAGHKEALTAPSICWGRWSPSRCGRSPDRATPAPVVAGLPTEPPPLTAGLPSSASTGGVGRPAVEASAGSGDPRTTAVPSTEPLCSLVLHRPLIPDAAKESLALQQAAAATALLRLNAPDKVRPLFQDQPDPRLRSYVLQPGWNSDRHSPADPAGRSLDSSPVSSTSYTPQSSADGCSPNHEPYRGRREIAERRYASQPR